jgi:hypothetical protein
MWCSASCAVPRSIHLPVSVQVSTELELPILELEQTEELVSAVDHALEVLDPWETGGGALVLVARFALSMWQEGRVPLEHAVAAIAASSLAEVDCFVLGAYLVSEHGENWTRDPDRCSHRGACGPYQLVIHWPRKFGYRPVDRLDTWKSAEIAARMLGYYAARERKYGDWRKPGSALRGPVSRPGPGLARVRAAPSRRGHRGQG